MCQASEGLSSTPVLANYLEQGALRHANPEVREHAECFLKLVEVIELILNSARYDVPGGRVDAACKRYLEQYRALYTEECMQPKFHELLHFGRFLLQFGWVPNCFVLERKHKGPKRFGGDNPRSNSNYSSMVMREVTARHLAVLQDEASVHFRRDAALIGPVRPTKQQQQLLAAEFGAGAQCRCSQTARINEWEKIARQDVVVYDWGRRVAVGRVGLLGSVVDGADRGLFAYVADWRILEERGRGWVCQPTGTVRIIMLDEIKGSVI